MKEKLLFSFCFTLAAVALVSGQARTVTNQDLEKYRDQRVKAEADLRDNYARLGFASPEERARRNAESAKASAELSARLRAERLERERLERERFELERRSRSENTIVFTTASPGIASDYWPQYYWVGGRRYWYQPRYVNVPRQQGYFAGGQFWPTGPATRPQPLFVKPRE